MKAILMVFALALIMSLAGNASNVSSVINGQTESVSVSQMNSSSSAESGKSKKGSHKHHHKRTSGSKKTK